LTSND